MTQTNKKRKFRITHIVFTVCLILIFAPILYMGWMLWSTYMDSRSPVLGNRYENNLDPAITKDQISSIDSAIGEIEGVQAHTIHLATATLRVYVDVADDAVAETVQATAESAYQAVIAVLDPNVYFTQANGMKMYDVEVHSYNLSEGREADNFIYGIYTKTSSMGSPQYQVVSEPKNAEIAQSLRDAVEARKAAEAAAAAEKAAQEAQQQEQPAEEQPAEGEQTTEEQQ